MQANAGPSTQRTHWSRSRSCRPAHHFITVMWFDFLWLLFFYCAASLSFLLPSDRPLTCILHFLQCELMQIPPVLSFVLGFFFFFFSLHFPESVSSVSQFLSKFSPWLLLPNVFRNENRIHFAALQLFWHFCAVFFLCCRSNQFTFMWSFIFQLAQNFSSFTPPLPRPPPSPPPTACDRVHMCSRAVE